MGMKLGICPDCRGHLWQDTDTGEPAKCDGCLAIASAARAKKAAKK